MSVAIKFTPGAARDPAKLERMKPTARLAKILGQAIRKRVETQGNLAGQRHRSYKAGSQLRLISPRYGATGGRAAPSGALMFKNSAEFHAAQGTRSGAYSISGGMWRGLMARGTGHKVSILFQGRSEGQEPKYVRGNRGVRARGQKVSNALKAATVLASHGVNVLALHRSEVEGVARAYTLAAVAALPSLGGVKAEWSEPPGGALAHRLARALAANR